MNRNDPPPPVPPAELPPDAPRGLVARFRNYFLTGLVVAGPIAITFYLTWWFVNWVDSLVRPFVPLAYRPETYLPFGLPGSGLIVAVIALTLLGFLTANLIGRTLGGSRRKTARAHARGARDLSRPQTGVRDVVLRPRIELSPGWPRRVSLAGDVVDRADLAGAERRGRQWSSQRGRTYFGVPALRAPNPTTGFFFYVPKSKIIEVEMSTEDAATLIMSCGVVQPGSDPQKNSPPWPEWRMPRGRECVRAASGIGEGGVNGSRLIRVSCTG